MAATFPRLRTRWLLIAILSAALAACNGGIGSKETPTPGISLLPDKPHVELQTLNEIFETAGSYLQLADGVQVVAFRCTIIEGTFCWFGDRQEDGAVSSNLARRVIDQVGSGAIENANRTRFRSSATGRAMGASRTARLTGDGETVGNRCRCTDLILDPAELLARPLSRLTPAPA